MQQQKKQKLINKIYRLVFSCISVRSTLFRQKFRPNSPVVIEIEKIKLILLTIFDKLEESIPARDAFAKFKLEETPGEEDSSDD